MLGIFLMPQNGDINRVFGVYKSLCCGTEIMIREGATFPDCKNHPKLSTVWKAIELSNPAEPEGKPDRRSA
jgi:hypothetical protein